MTRRAPAPRALQRLAAPEPAAYGPLLLGALAVLVVVIGLVFFWPKPVVTSRWADGSAQAPRTSAPWSTAAPQVQGSTPTPEDPIVAQNYHSPGGVPAGELRRSTVREGFDVVGLCSTRPEWLMVSPRRPGESWRAWVKAADVDLDPGAFTYADRMGAKPPDLCS